MGRWKEDAIDNEETQHSVRLAEELGITLDELSQLDYVYREDTGNDDILYGYVVDFNKANSPANILKRVKGLRDGHWVLLQPHWGEKPEDYDEESE